jgi:hypothetical protein
VPCTGRKEDREEEVVVIYLVMIDASKLTDPQHHRLLKEILLLGDGAREIAGDLRDSVPPVPLKWNAVDAPFEAVLDRIGAAVDDLVAEPIPPPSACRSPKRFPRHIVCTWCGNRYHGSFGTMQGDGCASAVFQVTEATLTRAKDPMVTPHGQPELHLGEWLVQGHYGSTGYDCQLYRFVQNPPAAAADPICDNCIGERIAAGDLVQIEGQFPW